MTTTLFERAVELLTSECVAALEWHFGSGWDCGVFSDNLQAAISKTLNELEDKDLFVEDAVVKLGEYVVVGKG